MHFRFFFGVCVCKHALARVFGVELPRVLLLMQRQRLSFSKYYRETDNKVCIVARERERE